MNRTWLIVAGLLVLALLPSGGAKQGVAIASKKDTESVILGEVVAQVLRAGGDGATHLKQLGGTRLVFDALQRGEIDVYPEYTGTLRQEIFAGRDAETDESLQRLLSENGIVMGQPLGFSNNYALAVRRDTAEKLHLTSISDLAQHADLRLQFSDEFLNRADGWKNLRKHYALPQEQVKGIDHDLAYIALDAGSVDVIDVYTTDARLAELDVVLLKDDKQYFPEYEAVLLWRADLADRFPTAVKQLRLLEGKIGQRSMTALNAQVQSGTANESQAAAHFLGDQLSIRVHVAETSVASEVWRSTLEHLDLVRRSLIPAIFAAIPLGILASKFPGVGRFILGGAGVVQTIPALALLVLLIPVMALLGLRALGAGSLTAVAALFLYSLLPIVQNTATGLSTIPQELHESALALGLSPRFRLWHIELPLATPSILAGVKTAAVLNVGFATLGALVGAGGYGQPILTGIRLNNTAMILQGAIPAACLAILLQVLFEVCERRLVPAGIRRNASRAK